MSQTWPVFSTGQRPTLTEPDFTTCRFPGLPFERELPELAISQTCPLFSTGQRRIKKKKIENLFRPSYPTLAEPGFTPCRFPRLTFKRGTPMRRNSQTCPVFSTGQRRIKKKIIKILGVAVNLIMQISAILNLI